MDVVVVEHPLVRSRLTDMRDARTDSASFRAALHELVCEGRCDGRPCDWDLSREPIREAVAELVDKLRNEAKVI